MIITLWFGHSLAMCPLPWHLKQVMLQVLWVPLDNLPWSGHAVLGAPVFFPLNRESISIALPRSGCFELLDVQGGVDLLRFVRVVLCLTGSFTCTDNYSNSWSPLCWAISTFLAMRSCNPSMNWAMSASSNSSSSSWFINFLNSSKYSSILLVPWDNLWKRIYKSLC